TAQAPEAPPPPIDAALAERAYAGARTYTGVLDCVGCIPSRLTVTIFADGRFRLREEPMPASGDAPGESLRTSTPPQGVAHGLWHVSPDAADRIMMEGDDGVRVFRRVVPDGLAIPAYPG